MQRAGTMAAQQLLQALQALYHGAPDVKDQANKWLEQFQGSAEAWQVTNDLLHNAGAGMEAHYFCAQTLRTKVSGSGVWSQDGWWRSGWGRGGAEGRRREEHLLLGQACTPAAAAASPKPGNARAGLKEHQAAAEDAGAQVFAGLGHRADLPCCGCCQLAAGAARL